MKPASSGLLHRILNPLRHSGNSRKPISHAPAVHVLYREMDHSECWRNHTFWWFFSHIKSLLRTCYAQGTHLGTGETTINKQKPRIQLAKNYMNVLEIELWAQALQSENVFSSMLVTFVTLIRERRPVSHFAASNSSAK